MAKKPAAASGLIPDAEYIVTFKDRAEHGQSVKFIPGREYRVRGAVLEPILDKADTYKAAPGA